MRALTAREEALWTTNAAPRAGCALPPADRAHAMRRPATRRSGPIRVPIMRAQMEPPAILGSPVAPPLVTRTCATRRPAATAFHPNAQRPDRMRADALHTTRARGLRALVSVPPRGGLAGPLRQIARTPAWPRVFSAGPGPRSGHAAPMERAGISHLRYETGATKTVRIPHRKSEMNEPDAHRGLGLRRAADALAPERSCPGAPGRADSSVRVPHDAAACRSARALPPCSPWCLLPHSARMRR